MTALIYGIINAVVGLPCMIGFAAVIFSDPMYKPVLGELARFSFLAAAVHQAAFTLLSSLPFAVGQPQDVGLIFLSSMATGVAEIGRQVNLSLAEITGTALLTIMVATIIVGLLTTAVARFKLATLVQYVPLPVVGGYLGYVGYFCLAAGVGLGAGVQVGSFSSWLNLFARDPLIKLAPTVVSALVLMLTMTRARSPWALPAVLVALPLAFHAVLLATGITLEQAQDAGWALKPQGKSTQQFWELYSMFNIKDFSLDGVYLPALLRQMPKMLGLFFVVTFGSCLDVAAIQADVPVPIDFNRELATVGVSNIVCGLMGSGYTGSYIFSQTIFSMRAGVSDRLHGWVIFGFELAVFLVPYAVAQLLPLYFYGSLLAVFGIEIAGDWLVRSRHKVTPAEYVLLLLTFLAIMQFELQMGVLIGIVLCLVYFAASYARMNITAFTVVPSRSAAVRTLKERTALGAFQGRSVAVGLGGYLFFGSSVLLGERVTKLAQDMVAQGGAPPRAAKASGAAPPSGGGAGVAEADGAHNEKLAVLAERAPCFVLLDFRRVLGVDATAAQLLGSLRIVLRQMGVELVLTRVRDGTMRRLFVAHGLVAPGPAEDDGIAYCRAFPTLSEGEQYAEDRFLAMVRAAGLLAGAEESLTLLQFLETHAQEGPLSQGLDAAAAAAGLAAHSAPRDLLPGDLLFGFDTPPDEVFLVLSGAVDVSIKHFSDIVAEDADDGATHGGGGGGKPRDGGSDEPQLPPERHFCGGPGAVLGGTDFVLQRPRSFRAVASAAGRVVAVDRAAYRRMAAAAPQAASFLMVMLLRDAALSEVYAYEVLERALLA
ncbi:MAG: hypothetical protein J3K34DRAFT_255209 [Monoraphidium minutum]|nr:MAG: hypothetical protein J3K34DRAFT_255209 [Monoraphidium minutum]